MKTAALITHAHPPADRGGGARRRLAGEAGWRDRAREEAKDGGRRGHRVLRRDAPDLCLVLGGDGSILRALRRFAGTGVPVFGVNFGTVGFLAAVEREEAEDGVRRALAGELETIELPGLEVSAGGVTGLGFNDVTLARRPHDRVAELSYRIAGKEVGHVRCDGLVAATPAGPPATTSPTRARSSPGG